MGSIFGQEGAEGPRGPDLRVDVEVPRSALGAPGGYKAHVPVTIEHEETGSTVQRTVLDGDAEHLPLHLPRNFSSGAMLRLRGQGGVCPEGRPGDLYVKVHVVEDPSPPLARWIAVAVGTSVVSGGVAWMLMQWLQ